MIQSIQCFSSQTEPCDHNGFHICGFSFRLMCIFSLSLYWVLASAAPYLGFPLVIAPLTWAKVLPNLDNHPALSEKGSFLPCLVEITAAGPTAGSPGI